MSARMESTPISLTTHIAQTSARGTPIRSSTGRKPPRCNDETIAVNLKSCFNYIRAVAPIMLAQEEGGRIVSMSSLNAQGGVTAALSRFSYAAAKAGILGMTRALAKELGPKVLINAICPGLIET